MKYNGKSIMEQSASANLAIDELVAQKGKCSQYDSSMFHLVQGEIYGAHLAHHLEAPLSDLTQSFSQMLKVSLCWEHRVGNRVAVRLRRASLIDWQGAEGRKEPYAFNFLLCSVPTQGRTAQRVKNQWLDDFTWTLFVVIPVLPLTPLLPERMANQNYNKLGDVKPTYFRFGECFGRFLRLPTQMHDPWTKSNLGYRVLLRMTK